MYVTLFNISTQTRTEHAKPTNRHPKSTKMSAITTNVLVSNLPSVDEPPTMPVGEYLYNKIEDLLKADPDRVAMIDATNNDRPIRLQTIHNEALGLASSLAAYNLFKSPEEDRVFFFAHDRPEYLTTLLAVAYLGLPACPSPPKNGAYDTYQRMLDLQPSMLVVTDGHQLATVKQMMDHPEWCAVIKSLKLMMIITDIALKPDNPLFQHPAAPGGIVTYDNLQILGENLPKLSSVPHFAIASLDSTPFLVYYTSGTSGKPKGAVHSHRSLMMTFITNTFMRARMIFAMIYPLGHISGYVCSFSMLLNSNMMVFYSGEQTSVETIFESVDRLGVTFLPLLPQMLAIVADTDKYQFGTVAAMYVGGSKVSPDLKRAVEKKYDCAVVNGYGSTEFLTAISHTNRKAGDETIGQLCGNVQLRILDRESGRNLPAGDVGEILLKGSSIFIGYWRNEAVTAEAIDADGWYHTGDLGKYDTEGNIYFVDRIKELIKYKGWSVAPIEIECFLCTHPAVADVCVVDVKHATEVSHIRAYCQLKSGCSVAEHELIEYVRANLGYQRWLTAGVVLIEHIPRTVIGKVDRQYFRKLVADELITQPAPLE